MRTKAAVVVCACCLALAACTQEKVASSRGLRANCRGSRLTKAERKKAENTMAGLKGHPAPSGSSPRAC